MVLEKGAQAPGELLCGAVEQRPVGQLAIARLRRSPVDRRQVDRRIARPVAAAQDGVVATVRAVRCPAEFDVVAQLGAELGEAVRIDGVRGGLWIVGLWIEQAADLGHAEAAGRGIVEQGEEAGLAVQARVDQVAQGEQLRTLVAQAAAQGVGPAEGFEALPGGREARRGVEFEDDIVAEEGQLVAVQGASPAVGPLRQQADAAAPPARPEARRELVEEGRGDDQFPLPPGVAAGALGEFGEGELARCLEELDRGAKSGVEGQAAHVADEEPSANGQAVDRAVEHAT